MVFKEFGSFAEGFRRGLRGEPLPRKEQERRRRRKKRSNTQETYNGF